MEAVEEAAVAEPAEFFPEPNSQCGVPDQTSRGTDLFDVRRGWEDGPGVVVIDAE
jgi:hypothetical protein